MFITYLQEKYNQLFYSQNNDQKPATKDDSYSTIPIGKKSSTKTTASLTETGNVPLVSKKDKNTLTNNTEEKKPEDVRNRLDRAFGGKYSKATREQKIQYIGRYFEECIKNNPNMTYEQRKRLQITNYKLLAKYTKNKEDYELLARSASRLEKENQLAGAQSAINDGETKELKHIGTVAVAHTVQNYDKSNQHEVTKTIVKTKDAEAIKVGASHASELDIQNQVEAVKIYQKAEISNNDKKALDFILINQYSKYAKENQVNIHKIMSNSKDKETVKYAAKNIYNLDKENQAEAFKYTVSTKNEEAINVAVTQWNYYDSSAKTEIKSVVENSEFESAKATLAKAEENSISQKISEIKEIVENNHGSAAISEKVRNLSDIEKIELLKQYPNSDVIRAIINTNPSLDVLANIDESYLKEMGYTNVGSNLCFLSASAQAYLVKENAANGTLNNINRSFLLASVKPEYDKLISEQKKEQKA